MMSKDVRQLMRELGVGTSLSALIGEKLYPMIGQKAAVFPPFPQLYS